jgi:hypothetical protein
MPSVLSFQAHAEGMSCAVCLMASLFKIFKLDEKEIKAFEEEEEES